MAAASSFCSEDQFLCSICLEVFNDPVTIPCGHNFCKTCITEHWNIRVQCQCPMCKELFDKRPKLRVNTFIFEMAAQFRRVQKKTGSSLEQQRAKPGDVLCDVCTETKLKALKSCLVCLTSYCETHLELHQKITGLKAHKLIDPVENLEDRMCKKHDRPLELFCKTDQSCVCEFCTESTSHKIHHIVPLIEEYEGKKTELGKTETYIHWMIQERRLKIQQIQQSVKLSEEDADRETADSVQVFTALIQSVERDLAKVIEMIKEKHKTTEKQAEGFITELEEEISELMERNAELEQLSRTEDHLQFLPSFPFLNCAPPTEDWTEVRVHSSYVGNLREAVAQLERTLSKEMKKLCADVDLKRVQRFAADVTLDPETAHPNLILSDDGKQVSYGEVKQILPDNPERFSSHCGVLGKQRISSGRFYYEVQVKEKTAWTLGVTRESINRKDYPNFPPENGLWAVSLTNGDRYKALAKSVVNVYPRPKPQKVGVFVDYEERLVSFYDADAAALIYSFTGCNFTENLCPYFNPSYNAGGMIICPVSNAD